MFTSNGRECPRRWRPGRSASIGIVVRYIHVHRADAPQLIRTAPDPKARTSRPLRGSLPLGPLLFDHRAARRATSQTRRIEHGVATKTSSTRCRPEISRNVRTCAESREQREGHPRSLIMPHLSTYSQFNSPIADRIVTASRSTTATAAHRATNHGARPRTRRGDGEASIRLRSMFQTSNQGFFLYSQCVRPTRRSSRFPFHRCPQWPVNVPSVLPTRQWRPVPALPLEGARQRDDSSTIKTCIAANAPEPKGLS